MKLASLFVDGAFCGKRVVKLAGTVFGDLGLPHDPLLYTDLFLHRLVPLVKFFFSELSNY